MNFMDVIKQRYSCRNFTDRPVSAEDIETILAVGGNAPVGAGAYDTLQFTVITDPALLDKFRVDPGKKEDFDPNFNAQALIVASFGPADWADERKQKVLGYQNVGAALSYMELAATELGIDSLYVHGYLDRLMLSGADVIDEIQLPENYTIAGGLALGYGTESKQAKSELINNVKTTYFT